VRADFKVCLDSCVLANIRLCDLLLRLAEKPRLFLPVWSEEILNEVHRTHVNRLGWDENLADYFQHEVRRFFPDALTNDFAHILPRLTNDEKDRHVLAATIRAGSSLILTFNLKHFPSESLTPWNVEATHPQDYLLVLYELDPAQVIQRVAKIAGQRDETQLDTLVELGKSCPAFAARLIDDLEVS
jgi:hypothetical protein